MIFSRIIIPCTAFILFLCLLLDSTLLSAQEEEAPPPLLADTNGDGMITIAAFGDSITRGVGDFVPVGEFVDDFSGSSPTGEAGYPLRVELTMGISVANLGKPGERDATGGVYRFAAVIPSHQSDIVVISEGTNDAQFQTDPNNVYRATQAMINIARASGKTPVLATIPPACCIHFGLGVWIENYNVGFRELALVNDIALADVNHAYTNTCNLEECYLLNLPEGAHPNVAGYDVIAEVVMAALLQIPIFAPDGALLLQTALGQPDFTVITRPDPVPAASAPTNAAQ